MDLQWKNQYRGKREVSMQNLMVRGVGGGRKSREKTVRKL